MQTANTAANTASQGVTLKDIAAQYELTTDPCPKCGCKVQVVDVIPLSSCTVFQTLCCNCNTTLMARENTVLRQI